MPDKKLGRPTLNPKIHKIDFRIDDETKSILDEFCNRNKINRTTALIYSIKKLKDDQYRKEE